MSGLPASWRGKAVNAFPETPELLHTPALPGSSDAVKSAAADQASTQGAGTLMISSDNVGGDAVVTINGGSHGTPGQIPASVKTGQPLLPSDRP